MMILISEVVHNGEVHLEFNSSLVEIISKVYGDQIVFRSEKEHAASVKKKLTNSVSVELITYDAYYNRDSYSWRKRIIGECKEILKSLKVGRANKVHLYVWSCLFPTGHFLLCLITLFSLKKEKHLIVLHGELEMLKKANRRKSEIFLGCILQSAIRISPERIKYLVLGDIIKTHLSTYFSNRILKRVISILHPYVYPQFVTNSICSGQPLIFCSIGTQMLAKNSHYIFELADHFKLAGQHQLVVFKTLGKVLPEINKYKNNNVQHLYAQDFVPQEKFDIEIKKNDFVLFFYDNNSYQLCASGAVFEAIKYNLPIVSIYNDYFGWLFNKYGDMGFLCTNVEEMKLLIEKISTGSLEREIGMIKNNITQFRLENDLNSIAIDLAKKL